MKLVINNCYGAFCVKPEIAKEYNFSPFSAARDNVRLITLLEAGVDCNTEISDLRIVEIPDYATDYEIQEYDGLESIIYVIDGKIYHLEA